MYIRNGETTKRATSVQRTVSMVERKEMLISVSGTLENEREREREREREKWKRRSKVQITLEERFCVLSASPNLDTILLYLTFRICTLGHQTSNMQSFCYVLCVTDKLKEYTTLV